MSNKCNLWTNECTNHKGNTANRSWSSTSKCNRTSCAHEIGHTLKHLPSDTTNLIPITSNKQQKSKYPHHPLNEKNLNPQGACCLTAEVESTMGPYCRQYKKYCLFLLFLVCPWPNPWCLDTKYGSWYAQFGCVNSH